MVGVDAFGLGLEVEDHAVPHGGQEDAADVFEADVVAAVRAGPAPWRPGPASARRAGWLPQRRYWLVIGSANGPSGCVASVSRTM